MLLLSILLSVLYAGLIRAYLRGWQKLPAAKPLGHSDLQKSVTVLIPARNEAHNIQACLCSIVDGAYPLHLVEIMVIDDFSEDRTAHIAQEFAERSPPSLHLEVWRLSDLLPPEDRFSANKKKALTLGVAQARGEIVVTTDADTIVPRHWLTHTVAMFENEQVQAVCGPVAFQREKNMLQRFQSLDFMGLMGITGAGLYSGKHFMANGANLSFRKKAFEAVGGYAGNTHLASGDDMFLVQKIASRWPGSLRFLKNPDATVMTEAAPDLRSFWHQRLRWGTKNAGIPNWPLRLSLLCVFLFCISIWANILLAFVDPSLYLSLFLFQLLVKALADYALLSEMCGFFGRKDLLRWFVPAFIMHTMYIPLVGTASLFVKKYDWKGRRSQ